MLQMSLKCKIVSLIRDGEGPIPKAQTKKDILKVLIIDCNDCVQYVHRLLKCKY